MRGGTVNRKLKQNFKQADFQTLKINILAKRLKNDKRK